MSVIDIHRAHSLDKEHAREAAETLAKDLSKQFDVNYQWEGDLLKFKRSAAPIQRTQNPVRSGQVQSSALAARAEG